MALETALKLSILSPNSILLSSGFNVVECQQGKLLPEKQQHSLRVTRERHNHSYGDSETETNNVLKIQCPCW